MDALFAIFSRRSVREYLPGKLEEGQIDNLLKAGMSAPSAGNARPWQFVVIDQPEKLAAIPSVHPYARMAAGAPLAVLICGDPEKERYPGFWPQDCAAAAQNILLAAHAQGLGAVWCGVYPEEERVQLFQEMFSIPPAVIPFALIVIGRSASEAQDPERYDSRRVHRNKYTA